MKLMGELWAVPEQTRTEPDNEALHLPVDLLYNPQLGSQVGWVVTDIMKSQIQEVNVNFLGRVDGS